MAEVYPSDNELLNVQSMEAKKITSELTLDDLRKTTWDYSEEEFVGLYHEKPILSYMFEVKECGNIDSLTVQKCNVAEGWVEYLECEGNPIKDTKGKVILPGSPKVDEEGNVMRGRLNCKVVIDILEAIGNAIVTLS